MAKTKDTAAKSKSSSAAKKSRKPSREEAPEEVSADAALDSDDAASDQDIESEIDAQLEMELESNEHDDADTVSVNGRTKKRAATAKDSSKEADDTETTEDEDWSEDTKYSDIKAKHADDDNDESESEASDEMSDETSDEESDDDASGFETYEQRQARENGRKKVQIEFPYSQVIREKVPKVFQVAETVAEEWVNDGDFEKVPVGHPLAQITVAAGLRKAKEVEKKLEEKGVFAMAKMGLEYAKSQINDKIKKK